MQENASKGCAQMVRKGITKPAQANAQATVVTKVTPDVEPVSTDESDTTKESPFTPQQERALNLLLRGVPRQQVAEETGVHRNTIGNWCKESAFALELATRLREHQASVRIRRTRDVNNLNDRLTVVTSGLLKNVESKLKIDDKGRVHIDRKDEKVLGISIRMFRELGYELREFRETERKDMGDDIKKVDIRNNTTVTGDLNVQHSNLDSMLFADYMKRAIGEKIIDVDSIDAPDENPERLLLKAAERVLVDTDLLDRIAEEDKVEEEANNQ
jgi:hypothetical protein